MLSAEALVFYASHLATFTGAGLDAITVLRANGEPCTRIQIRSLALNYELCGSEPDGEIFGASSLHNLLSVSLSGAVQVTLE